jgi:HPt (histidine-containing phosphotransfer) domain-containing protein
LDFVNGLFPLINEMEHQRQSLEHGHADPSRALECLQRCAHKISGIAGSVGFTALGQKAGRLDATLCELLKRTCDHREIAALQAPVEDLLDAMEAVLDYNL